ncbi:peptidase S8 [Marinobacter guineae]|uniref:Peptidase S8 n=1 Tax=Marinobacter guineae TaxID=432303 RepID=A0A2G1VJZ8_9GAMM|nr:S8 family serine peptidase [Marinobacter guineae]PHQ26910.1 peptidase S8 [Marinobacter guineae]
MLREIWGVLFMVLASVPGNLGRMCISMALGLAVVGCGGGSGSGDLPAPVALAGTIDIEAGTRVDADNADALLGRAPLTSAQLLPPEFILAGYVSDTTQVRDYPSIYTGSDPFQYFPDPEDRYVSSLQAGLELTLQSFATRLGTASDLRLTVEAPDGTILAEKTAPGNGSPVTIALDSEQSGDYTLSVTALGAPPMLYILSSSRTETPTATAYDWPRHEFVQDEAIVSLRDPGVRGNGLPASALMAPGRQIAPGLWTVRRPAAVAALSQSSPAEQTLAWIRSLRDDPAIRHASPNYKTQAFASPVDEPLYPSSVLGQQWHYALINGPVAWQLAPGGGSDVNVAVLDTGLFRDGGQWHPDLTANVIAGFDAVDGDDFPADPGNAVGGSVYHGTHVAGTVAAAVNGIGGAGVAFGSNLMAVRVLGEGGSGTLSDLLEGMQWVLGDQARPSADVVNLSLGGLPCGDPGVAGTLQQLINQGVEKGIIYVAAAGNSATSEPSCPAALENVFSVSAVDGAGSLSSYSNFGSTIDLAAPGGDASRDGNGDGQGDLVSSTSAAVVDGQLQAVYRGLQGTSMAAPHVSGVLALMKEVRPALNSGNIDGYLINGDLTLPPCEAGCNRTDQLGYGLLDAGKAIQAVLSGSPPELLTASPAVVNLAVEAGVSSPETVEFSRLGDSAVRITGVSASDDWFFVSRGSETLPLAVDSENPVAELELALIPENLETGLSSRGSFIVTYETGSEGEKRLAIPVIGQQITDQQARDAGRHFVLLVEPEPQGDTFVTVGQTVATVNEGQYQFEFLPDDGQAPQLQNEVPPGEYFLVAGTDLDNDGLICHAGEACAEYPVAGLRQIIEVRENQLVTGLRMTTSYSRPALSVNSPDFLPRPDFVGYRLLSEQAGSQSTSVKAIQIP